MQAVIFLGGDFALTDVDRELHVAKEAGELLVIAADRGLRAAELLGWEPQFWVGDGDSLEEWPTRAGMRYIRYPVEKDKSDGELATRLAIGLGADSVTFLGALGGRLDHELANLQLLAVAAKYGLPGRILGSGQEVTLVSGHRVLAGRVGQVVSLFALGVEASGVTLRGFRYALTNARLPAHSSLGLSNVLVSNTASVQVDRGRVLVVRQVI